MGDNKEALDARISDNYLSHNYAELMRLAYFMSSYMTEEERGAVLKATEVRLFVEDKVVTR